MVKICKIFQKIGKFKKMSLAKTKKYGFYY